MPYERDTPCPAPEFNLKNQHRNPHTCCTMDGHDQDPKQFLGIPTAADTTPPRRKMDGKTKETTTQCPMNETHPAPHRRTIRKINTENPIPPAQWMETIKTQNRAWEFPPPQTLYTPQRKIDGKTTEKTTQCPMNETHPAPHRRTIRKITTENGEPESREF